MMFHLLSLPFNNINCRISNQEALVLVQVEILVKV